MSSLSILSDALYETKAYVDVTFVANDDSRHEFHRDIVARHSPVIKAMLASDEKKAEVPFEYDGAVLANVRKLVYGKQFRFVDIINTWDTWRFAQQYDFESIMSRTQACMLQSIPNMSMSGLRNLMIAVEKVTTNDLIKTAVIDELAKYVDKDSINQPCKLIESKINNVKCCKCMLQHPGVFGGGGGGLIAPICAKEFCCLHRVVKSKKRAFDEFTEGFVTFKVETQLAILRVKYNV